MAGDRFRLEVKERTGLGTPESRRLRKQGFIPGVLYGRSTAQAFAVGERELRAALTGPSGLHAVLDVVLEGQTTAHPSILKEYQRDPIRGHVRHIDLQEVRLDVAIQATVNVHLHGAEDAPGIKEGGVLNQPATTLNVEALPMEVPESIEADVSGLEMGGALRLEDIPKLEGVTFLDDPHETVIATVSAPIVEVEPEPEEGEELAEGEEAPEGEAEGETPEGEAAAESDSESSDSEGSGSRGDVRRASDARGDVAWRRPQSRTCHRHARSLRPGQARSANASRAATPPRDPLMRLFRRGESASTLDLLVVGLGNPGREHARDRHNAGWMVVDELARRHDGSFRSKFSGQLAEVRVGELRLALLKPETYMNLSGSSLAAAARFFKLPTEQIAVVHDDVDLDPGRIQLRLGGGLAGHNGLRSIRQSLGSAEFLRVRAGVGRPGRGDRRPVADYVLSPFAPEDDAEALIARSADAVETLAAEGLDEAQRRFN